MVQANSCTGLCNKDWNTGKVKRYGLVAWMLTATFAIVNLSTIVAAQQSIPNYDSISIPTDLVAPIVSVEDDIALTSLPEVAEPVIAHTSESSAESDVTESAVAEITITETSESAVVAEIEKPESTELPAIAIATETDSAETQNSSASISVEPTKASATNIDSETVVEVAGEIQLPTRIEVKKPIAAASEADLQLASTDELPVPTAEPMSSTEGTILAGVIDQEIKSAQPETPSPTAESSDDTVEKETAGTRGSSVTDKPAESLSINVEDSGKKQSVEVAAVNTDNELTSGATRLSEAQQALAAITPSDNTELVDEEQEQRINEDEIIVNWATAWSNNDIESYLSFYDKEFIPADPNLSRENWENIRRKRLKNQDIRIIVSNAQIYRADNQSAEIRFTQRYTSKDYRDRVIKSIEMIETAEGWKFLSERVLEELPFE